MALVFVVQNGAVKPVLVTSGMVVTNDTPAWQMNRGDLHQLTKADLESILAIGGYGGRLVATRDKKTEYVDLVERIWNRILEAIAERNVGEAPEEGEEAEEAESEDTEETESEEAEETESDDGEWARTTMAELTSLIEEEDIANNGEKNNFDNPVLVRLLRSREDARGVGLWTDLESSTVGDMMDGFEDADIIQNVGDYSVFYQGEKKKFDTPLSDLFGENLGIANTTFYLKVRKLRGGGLVRKPLTKAEMLTKLKQKSKDYINKSGKEDEPADEESIPKEIKDYIAVQRSKLAEVIYLKTQGHSVIAMALKTADTSNLQAVQAMMSKPFHGKLDTSECRILKAMYMLLPTVSEVDEGIKGLKLVQKEIAVFFAGVYAEQYNMERHGDVCYDHQEFLRDVAGELGRRISPTFPAEAQGSNCTVS